MFTPEQLEEVAFSRVRFGGYSIHAVDEVLEPLIADYTAIYQENALLKNKMRLLVEKLEQYRSGEAEMRESMVRTQNTCDQMLLDTEAKCAQMLSDASAAVAESQRQAGVLIEAEHQRAEEAKRLTCDRVSGILAQLSVCTQMLERLCADNAPTAPPKQRSTADDVADEIESSLLAMVGTAEEPVPKAAPQHPTQAATARYHI